MLNAAGKLYYYIITIYYNYSILFVARFTCYGKKNTIDCATISFAHQRSRFHKARVKRILIDSF